jgi:hypothetical protein
MKNIDNDDWRGLCREEGIDPAEVRLVYERYDAYRRYTDGGAGDPLGVDQWFRFYYREKTSEGIQAGAVPEGCSADGDAVNNACLAKPAVFLRVLIAYGNAGGVLG